MNQIYEDFFRMLLSNSDRLQECVDELYSGDKFSNDDLNQIFGTLKKEGLISCQYANNRAWVRCITFAGKHYFDAEESDKPRLIELIDQASEVEKAFHTVGGEKGFPEVEEIHDTQVFQDWIQELTYELQQVFDATGDSFVKDTLDLVSHPFNGWRNRKDFTQIKGKLNAIKRNQSKYFPKDTVTGENMSNDKKPLIFISHSSANKDDVALLVELLRAIDLKPQQDIFCSSLPGYDIPIDTDIFEFLRSRFLEYKLHIFCIHSPEYYASAVSLNEMGAAWALKTEATSFLLPGFGFDGMKGVINDRSISIKLDHDIAEVKDKLNQLRKKLEQEFDLTPIPDITWETARDKFITEINRPKEQGQQPNEDIIELLKMVAATSDGVILTPSDLSSGTSIQVGDKVLASEYPNRREFAKWDAALKACIQNGFVEKKNKDFYVITNSGYKATE